MLFKSLSHLLSMTLQKYVILATSLTNTSGINRSTEIVATTGAQDTLKKLCRFL